VKRVEATSVKITFGDPDPKCDQCKGTGRKENRPCSCTFRFGKEEPTTLFVAVQKTEDGGVALDIQPEKERR